MTNNESDDLRRLFGANVRVAREALGWTQGNLVEQLPKSMGMTRDKILRMEAGTRPTPLEEAAAVADVLGRPLAELLGEGGDAASHEAVTLIRLAVGSQTRLAQAAQDLDQRAEDVRAIPPETVRALPKKWRNVHGNASLTPEDYLGRYMNSWRDIRRQERERVQNLSFGVEDDE